MNRPTTFLDAVRQAVGATEAAEAAIEGAWDPTGFRDRALARAESRVKRALAGLRTVLSDLEVGADRVAAAPYPACPSRDSVPGAPCVGSNGACVFCGTRLESADA